MSAYPGTDLHGAYALFESACCWDPSQSQNSQMSFEIASEEYTVAGIEGSRKLLDLTRSYMRVVVSPHQYINIVDSKVLKRKRIRFILPRLVSWWHRFTQYWVEIGKPIQDEIISRTESMKGVSEDDERKI